MRKVNNSYSPKQPVVQALNETYEEPVSGRNWCAARVRAGAEDKVRLWCREHISSELLKECYVFHYEEKRRIKGEWTIQERILFPGYVFLIIDTVRVDIGNGKIERLEREINGAPGILGLVKANEEVITLTDEEVNLLQTFGGYAQKVAMSEGVIERSKIRVYSGPLVGKERYIRKIDRHKRRAVLEMPVCGRLQRVQVGLEIVSKT